MPALFTINISTIVNSVSIILTDRVIYRHRHFHHVGYKYPMNSLFWIYLCINCASLLLFPLTKRTIKNHGSSRRGRCDCGSWSFWPYNILGTAQVLFSLSDSDTVRQDHTVHVCDSVCGILVHVDILILVQCM